MATDEEKAAIMAEYLKSVRDEDNDDNDEEELDHDDDSNEDDEYHDYFNPHDEDDDEDDDDEFYANEEEDENESHVQLHGSLTMNEQGKLVYSGIWNMSHEVTQGHTNDDDTSIKNTNKNKFELTTQEMLKGKGHPLLPLDEPRCILFDGYFTTTTTADTNTSEPTEESEKSNIQSLNYVHESNVQLVFGPIVKTQKPLSSSFLTDFISTKSNTTSSYHVKGRGMNEYGCFTIQGIYAPHPDEFEKDHSLDYSLICEKRYVKESSSAPSAVAAAATASASTRSTRHHARSRAGKYNNDDISDDDMSNDEGANYEELIGLHEDANLSVEELRRKYYGGGALSGKQDNNQNYDDDGDENSDNDAYEKMPKKTKYQHYPEDDDDDGCGF
jgi:hypothetical protein